MVNKDEVFRHIGAKIAYYRRLKRLTQEELAMLSNLSRSSIARIEQGKYNHNISLSILIDIAIALEVEWLSLLIFDEKDGDTWNR